MQRKSCWLQMETSTIMLPCDSQPDLHMLRPCFLCKAWLTKLRSVQKNIGTNTPPTTAKSSSAKLAECTSTLIRTPHVLHGHPQPCVANHAQGKFLPWCLCPHCVPPASMTGNLQQMTPLFDKQDESSLSSWRCASAHCPPPPPPCYG